LEEEEEEEEDIWEGRKAFNECWKEGCRRGQKLAGGLLGSSIFSYGGSYEKIDGGLEL
jgi:hypothetical protein